MWTNKNKLMVSVTNIPEFNALIEKARAEAEQLNNTIAQLSRFDLVVSFDVVGDQTGDIEDASQPDGSAGGCWRINTYKAGAAEAEERLYDPGEIEHGTPVKKRDHTEAEKQMAETVVRYTNQRIRDGGARLV